MEAWTIWLIAAAILLIIEVCTQMMWSLCFSVGALIAMVCSLCGLDATWQIVTMIVVSFLSYIFLLPVFKRWHAKTAAREARTGMDALLGRRAMVTHEIKPGSLGRARIDGDNWQVKAPSATDVIHVGEEVVVTAYDSIILTVSQTEKE